MKTIIKLGAMGLFASTLGILASACAANAQDGAAAGEPTEHAAETSEALTTPVTCSSTCSATGGAAISKSCTSSCSATASSVTCDGVVTNCTTVVIGGCSAGQIRSCCAYAGGCGCQGDQTCNASGQWGSCIGSRPHGQMCP